MANPPVPVERKRRTGNPGKRKLPDVKTVVVLPAAHGVPVPSRPLGVAGGELWRRVWSVAGVWLSPSTDVHLLELTCEALDERDGLRELVMSGAGDWRDRSALRALDSQIASNLSLLGLTPTDRARLGLAEVKAQSKLEELRSKQAQR